MKLVFFALFDFLAWPFTLLLMCAGALPAVYAGLSCYTHLPLPVTLALIPVYYFIWLFSFLVISSLEMSLFGLFLKKPKSLVFLEDMKSTLMAIVLHNISKRQRLIWSIPFVEKLLIPTYSLPFIPKLVFGACSLGKIKIGRMSAVYTFPTDADLLEVGNNVVIGVKAMLVSHALKTTADGKVLYITEPIIIADNVTVGSDSFISMGVKIGKGALVLAKSYVEARTVIKENEVWGGNPARFIRMRSTKD